MADPTREALRERSARLVGRGAVLARISGFVMIALGGIFAVAGLRHPLSPGFVISLAVFVNGIIEWRGASALRAFDERAPVRLALNQTALGIEIVIYAVWQAGLLTPEAIDALLASPMVAPVLGLYPPDAVAMIREMLPELVRLFYYLVAVVAVLACGGTAIYYRSRYKHLLLARSDLPPGPPPVAGAGQADAGPGSS